MGMNNQHKIQKIVLELDRFLKCRYGVCSNCKANIIVAIRKLNKYVEEYVKTSVSEGGKNG